jgi:fumarylacetoacetate (FAA) hydrolase
MLETINQGEAKTPFMQFGDRIKIEMLNTNQENIFGAIDQTVSQYTPT